MNIKGGCDTPLILAKLHGIGSGYVEAEAFGSAEASFKKKVGSGNDFTAIPQRFRFRFRFRRGNRSLGHASMLRRILGRPFLATAGAIMDFQTGESL
ncbi:unnamed protein product [Microthlaspi erraticum]|uniref:Uncharacterized protein n=1 Tax=Microthlaspi erraticum TaxID=1685480 RepID=A0A6D2I650_9BRAS|nr:unnamed protein product [Microthlaspi erraticum]